MVSHRSGGAAGETTREPLLQESADGSAGRPGIGVFCVDDNALVAEAFGVRLSRAEGFVWLGHANTTRALITRLESAHPDVMLLDIDMPGEDTFAALQRISNELPDVRVLMVSGHVRPDLIDRAIECGAWGYVSKNEAPEVIVEAIEQVAHGQFVMSEIVTRACQQK